MIGKVYHVCDLNNKANQKQAGAKKSEGWVGGLKASLRIAFSNKKQTFSKTILASAKVA